MGRVKICEKTKWIVMGGKRWDSIQEKSSALQFEAPSTGTGREAHKS